MKVASTTILRHLAVDAMKRGYNRQLDVDELNEHADPDGIHVLNCHLIHGDRDPHARCRVMIKSKNSMLPSEAWLDVELKLFELLPEFSDLIETNQG